MRKFIEKKFLVLITLSIILRLLVILLTPEIADSRNAHRLGELYLKTRSVYRYTRGINPYPPLFIYYYAFTVLVSSSLRIPFVYIVKILPLLSDIGIMLLLIKYLENKKAIFWYALNPIVIVTSSAFGKEEPFIIFLAFLAYLSFVNKKSIFSTSILLATSIWLKVFPILLFPLIFFKIKNVSKKIIFMTICILPFILIILPFVLTDFQNINATFFSYGGSADYGWLASFKALSALISGTSINFTPINNLLPQLLNISKYAFLIFYLLLLVFLLKQAKKSLLLSIILIFLLFFIVYGGIGTNFLFWIVPFIILYDYNLAKSYTLIGFPAVLFYLLGQFYDPVLRHYDFFLFRTPTFINLFYFLSTSIFWFYLVVIFFNLLTQNNSKARLGSR